MAIQLGDTFVLGLGGHLWVVISDPCKHAGDFVIVNITTDVNRAGTDCELNAGDHQWVRHKSYVNFGDARKVNPTEGTKISAYMANGTIAKHFPVNPVVLQKIIAAAKTSKALPTGFLAYI